MLMLEPALPQDADAITALQVRAFDELARQYGQTGTPPDYDSVAWLIEAMGRADCYKILLDGVLVGAAIVFDEGDDRYYLGRIFIAVEYQNRGLGAQAMALVEAAYPTARHWALDTPEWALRNRHFYEKLGYVITGTLPLPDKDFSLVLYEKAVA